MSLVQSIENRLMEINEAVFQELCDRLLIFNNENYRAFSRSGSQAGKQKTVKGTPDSFLLLPNGKYIFVEYSTNVTQGKKKLKEDILKCLDVSKTGIKHELIDEIILCVNFKLNTKEIEELKKELVDTAIKLYVLTLDRIAIEIASKNRTLASEYLGLSIDSGQIVSVEQFIKEYNKAFNGIATPLDNKFLFREEEMNQLIDAINKEDLIVVSGSPGVGKTKLVLESINKFMIDNPNYSAYCFSNKNYPVLEDLNNYLLSKHDYILFIDDANKIDYLKQILGFQNKFDEGKLKIILTVRHYALHEIKNSIVEKKKIEIHINKLTDEQLLEIIKGEPFCILNEKYHKRILDVADGNPRIAIMASILAKEKQSLTIFHDLSDLFEKYFSIFLTDSININNKITVQTLGLISVFNALPYKDKEIMYTILESFNIEYKDFIEEILYLEEIELVDVQYDYVTITEQNISNYFFYLAFIKEEYLTFDILLKRFYANKAERIRDSIIAANNSYGYEKVIKKVKSSLVSYFESINEINEKLAFLKTFWFYLQNELMAFMYTYTSNMVVQSVEKYDTKYEHNQFSYKRNAIIELFGNYFEYIKDNLNDILILSIEYIRKTPKDLPELIYQLKQSFAINIDDHDSGYYRQFILLEVLDRGLTNDDELYKVIFFEIAAFLFEVKFERVRPGKRNTVTFENLEIIDDPKIIQLRELVLDILSNQIGKHDSEIIWVLKKYSSKYNLNNNIAKLEKEKM